MMTGRRDDDKMMTRNTYYLHNADLRTLRWRTRERWYKQLV